MTDFLDDFAGYDTPHRLILKHPATNEPMPDKDGEAAYVDIYSPRSVKAEEYQKARYQELVKDAKKNNKKPPTYEEAKAKDGAFYAAMTAGAFFVKPSTGVGQRDPDTAALIEIYSNPHAQWIIAQMNEAMADDTLFLTGTSSPAS